MPTGKSRVPKNPQLRVRVQQGRVEMLATRAVIWGDSALLIVAISCIAAAARYSHNSNLLVFLLVVCWGGILFYLQLASSLTPLLSYDPSTRTVRVYHFHWFKRLEEQYSGPPRFSVRHEINTARRQQIWILSLEAPEGSMDLARAAHYAPLDELAQQFLQKLHDPKSPNSQSKPHV